LQKENYKNWIKNYTGDIYRKCVQVSKEMQLVFPELIIAQGMVKLLDNGKWYPHQWLVDLEGNIVDPTAHQWIGIEEYKHIGKNDDKPVGKCMQCGEWMYGKVARIFCNDECNNKYIEYEKQRQKL